MTAFKITSTTSVFSTNADAFDSSSSAADSLTIDDGAYLVAINNGFYGADLDGQGIWTVKVNGSISSTEAYAIFLRGGIAGTSSITIGASGEIGAYGSFVNSASIFADSAVSIKNDGVIRSYISFNGGATNTLINTGSILRNYSNQGVGAEHAIENTFLSGATNITNTGYIDGYITLANGNDVVTNNGIITGEVRLREGNNKYTSTSAKSSVDYIFAGNGNDTIQSAGAIEGVQLGNGKNSLTLTKTGTSGEIIGGLDNDTITNAGTITGDVDLKSGADTFTNSGKLTGNFTSSGITTFKNSGTIEGDVSIGGTVTNSGVIVGSLSLEDGTNKVTNSGTIDLLNGGNGTDSVSGGRFTYSVWLAGGNDKFTGGNFVDKLYDGDGSDEANLGGGNDIYYLYSGDFAGLDKIDGGAGIDTYSYNDYPGGSSGGQTPQGYLIVNIDTVFHEEKQVTSIGRVEANTATGRHGTDLALGGNDTIKNFENVYGSGEGDVIFGNALVNKLEGSGGDDGLFGYGGNDILEGGDGKDNIVGGLGADKLTGGADVDQFIYLSTAESGPLKAARDTILDFDDDVDIINVSVIDSNTKNGGTFNEAFRYIGVNVAFVANDPAGPGTLFGQGSIRVIQTATGWTIEGEINNDGKADFAIDVVDAAHNITFTETDFIL